MYKETFDVLMEDINDHSGVKETILKNQLEYHFTHKTPENKDVLDNAAVIVRRVLQEFALNKIIGVQPVTDNNKPTVVSGGITCNIETEARRLSIGYSVKGLNSDLEFEINHAIACEIEAGLVNEFLKTIADNSPEINLIAPKWGGETISRTIRDAANEINANWVVVSPMILAMMQSDVNARFQPYNKSLGTMGDLLYVGQLVDVFLGSDDNIAVYCSLWMGGTDDIVLAGYKDPNSEDTPIIYAPEIMLMPGKKELNGASEEWYPFSTKYGKFIHQGNVEDHYRKISIKFDK